MKDDATVDPRMRDTSTRDSGSNVEGAADVAWQCQA
jgi:hypothetical protein